MSEWYFHPKCKGHSSAFKALDCLQDREPFTLSISPRTDSILRQFVRWIGGAETGYPGHDCAVAIRTAAYAATMEEAWRKSRTAAEPSVKLVDDQFWENRKEQDRLSRALERLLAIAETERAPSPS